MELLEHSLTPQPFAWMSHSQSGARRGRLCRPPVGRGLAQRLGTTACRTSTGAKPRAQKEAGDRSGGCWEASGQCRHPGRKCQRTGMSPPHGQCAAARALTSRTPDDVLCVFCWKPGKEMDFIAESVQSRGDWPGRVREEKKKKKSSAKAGNQTQV